MTAARRDPVLESELAKFRGALQSWLDPHAAANAATEIVEEPTKGASTGPRATSSVATSSDPDNSPPPTPIRSVSAPAPESLTPGAKPTLSVTDAKGVESEANQVSAAGVEAAPTRPDRPRSAAEFRASLEHVGERARLKSEACRMAAITRRQEHVAGSADSNNDVDLRSAEGALFARAKELPDCYLWSLDPKRAPVVEAELELAAEVYDNLARAVDLARVCLAGASAEDPPPRRLMSLMAEGQSAVYAMLWRIGVRGDRDQLQVFAWLRERTDYHRIYIPRFMDRARLAKPEDAPDLLRRLTEFESELTRGQELSRLAGKLCYQVDKAAERSGDALADEWWRHVADTLDQAAQIPSARDGEELREALGERTIDIPATIELSGSARDLLSKLRITPMHPDAGTPSPPLRRAVGDS